MGDVVETIAQTMAECITQISGVNPDIVKSFMIGVNAALAVTGVVAVAFSKIPFTSMLSAAGSLLAVITAIGAGVGVGSMIASNGIKHLQRIHGERQAESDDQCPYKSARHASPRNC